MLSPEELAAVRHNWKHFGALMDMSSIGRMLDTIDHLVGLLEELEWEDWDMFKMCPMCRTSISGEHAFDCELAAALKLKGEE